MIEFKKGNIFTSQCDTIVNTVNCSGVMGAGIALEFKLRYPSMYQAYQSYCESGALSVGKLWHFKDMEHRFHFSSVLNFPTKQDWKAPSKMNYLERGLQKFVDTYARCGIKSIAFPVLGGGRGGLNETEVIAMMEKYLSPCDDLLVEIWQYDPKAEDDLFPFLQQQADQLTDGEFLQLTELKPNIASKVKVAVNKKAINSVRALSSEPGIGETTINKLIEFCRTKPQLPLSLI